MEENRSGVGYGKAPDYAAAEIPGETLGMLIGRISERFRERGVEVGTAEVGKVLADYAGRGYVKLAPGLDTKPVLCQWIASMFSFFFGEQNDQRAVKPSPVFRLSDNNTPKGEKVELSAFQSGAVTFDGLFGVTPETFRGMVREAEEEDYLSEEVWRRIDAILLMAKERYSATVGNYEIRAAERISTVLLTAGMSEAEALDRALGASILPAIVRTGTDVPLTELNAFVTKQFPSVSLPLCGTFSDTF